MEIMSYIASLFATVFGICAPFGKKMRTVLCFNFMTNVMTGISYILIGGYSGGGVAFLGGAQLFINYIFNEKKGKIPAAVVFLHMVAFIVISLCTFSAWYDILMLIASLLFVVSVAQTDSKYYRIIFFTNCATLVFYDLFAKAYGNLFMHIALFSATIVAILIRDTTKKKRY